MTNAQSCRMRKQIPLARRVALQYLAREAPCQRIVWRSRFGCAVRAAQCFDDALENFTRGLAREGHRDDRFGLRRVGEQRQEALDQQAGFARARRRLHDERARDVERRAARSIVISASLIHRRDPRRRRSGPNRCGTAAASRTGGRATASCAAPRRPTRRDLARKRAKVRAPPRLERTPVAKAAELRTAAVRAGHAPPSAARPIAAIASGLNCA